jgi:general secretion pathway protein K
VSFRGFAGIAAIGRDRVQGEALFTAGLEVAASMVASSAPFTEIETIVNLSTGAVRARLSDEGGRIDVGRAPAEVLAALLRSVGAPEPQANDAAQRIVQWRNRNNNGSPSAPMPAGNTLAKSLGTDTGQPFADVLEIAQVPGVAPQWVAALTPLTTVYGSETVNPLTAPAAVIAALPGVNRVQLETFLAARRASPTDERIGAALGPAQRFLATKREQVVGVELAETLPDGYAAAARAVMVLMPQDSQPYRILVWTPLPPSTLR